MMPLDRNNKLKTKKTTTRSGASFDLSRDFGNLWMLLQLVSFLLKVAVQKRMVFFDHPQPHPKVPRFSAALPWFRLTSDTDFLTSRSVPCTLVVRRWCVVC